MNQEATNLAEETLHVMRTQVIKTWSSILNRDNDINLTVKTTKSPPYELQCQAANTIDIALLKSSMVVATLALEVTQPKSQQI